MNEKCGNCGRTRQAHLRGDVCPLDTHVVIDTETLARVEKTGHPRLLKNVLTGKTDGVLADVTIENAVRDVVRDDVRFARLIGR